MNYHECTTYCTHDRLARHSGLVPENIEDFQKLADIYDLFLPTHGANTARPKPELDPSGLFECSNETELYSKNDVSTQGILHAMLRKQLNK